MSGGRIVQTDDLIATLSDQLTPVQPGLVMRRLGLGLVIGLVCTFLLLCAILKLRPDLAQALTGGAFWMKFAYTFAIAGLGLWIVERQSRPGTVARMPGWLLAVPLLVLVGIAAAQLAAPGADRHALMMGQTARICSVLILALSLPIFAGLFWAMRQLAPTRLAVAGAGAGILAGAASATLYGFHCPETAAPFILVWYTLGIVLAACLGAIAGRWLLRW